MSYGCHRNKNFTSTCDSGNQRSQQRRPTSGSCNCKQNYVTNKLCRRRRKAGTNEEGLTVDGKRVGGTGGRVCTCILEFVAITQKIADTQYHKLTWHLCESLPIRAGIESRSAAIETHSPLPSCSSSSPPASNTTASTTSRSTSVYRDRRCGQQYTTDDGITNTFAGIAPH